MKLESTCPKFYFKDGTVISTIKDVKEHNEGVKSQIKEIKEDII